MDKIFRLGILGILGIKGKILLIIIPLLVCSFAISGHISVFSSRKSLFDVSSRFILYKMEQLENYAYNQWQNLQNSGFAENPVYTEIVQKSVVSYTRGMIRKDSEYIFAIDNDGELQFSTADINYSKNDWNILQSAIPHNSSILFEFSISGITYIGHATNIPNFNWNIFVVEDKRSFTNEIREMTYLQSLTFITSLILIIIGLLISLGILIGPIQRVREAIHKITIHKDFSRKIKIEYPDEIGELAFDFNNMTTNLNLSYNKLKKYALDEAIARKKVYIRENETLGVLGRASDYKDPETGAHITRVSGYSSLLSESLGHDAAIQDLLYRAAPLHDIGKLGIADSILLHPGPLTNEKSEIMKTHTTIGYEILKDSGSKYLKAGAVIALSHHEKYDGTGYPKGLKGDEIPVFGKIVSIADVFDALSSKRPYKDPWPFEKVVDYIRKERGKHFDPDLVDLFISNLSKVEQIFLINEERK